MINQELDGVGKKLGTMNYGIDDLFYMRVSYLVFLQLFGVIIYWYLLLFPLAYE